MTNDRIRNIAIIAHVDHGKTSLLNEMLKQSGAFKQHQEVVDRVMDSNALERERGITILAKNTSLNYANYKINVVDTPGHADFGGEVERVLKMAEGVLLVVDAYEGPMPQTRFVLQKALELNLKVIVVVNKIDRPDARINEVVDEVLELLIDLDATNDQLNSPIVYASARLGIATTDKAKKGTDMKPLLDEIVKHIPSPTGDLKEPLQVLVSNTEINEYVGKIAVGKINRGTVSLNQPIIICNHENKERNIKAKISSILQFDGLNRIQVQQAVAGDIVCLAGSEEVKIGDTICAIDAPEALPFSKISEPSVEMTFLVNDSPFSGKEGKYVTSRHIRDRLYREAAKDLSLKVSDGSTTESFYVRGRGEMHLSILIENMRRDGYEFQVSMPRVLYKEIDGVKCEPVDRLILDVPEDAVGVVMSKMGVRRGDLLHMSPHGHGRMRMEFLIPSRGLFGYKSEFMTDTKGEGIINYIAAGYEPFRGEIERRNFGALVAFETGTAVQYGLYNAQERGTLFTVAGEEVYMGQVVGTNSRQDDLVVNVCKKKQLTNMRSSASDEALRLTPAKILSLEEAIEFIGDDEYLEVTPKSIRIRKMILEHTARGREKMRKA
ncbi:MAG: translational GTPase TypA [Christensenellaceae bacterium]|nr:translational GTPase TypA [Christensenellaceae bacterium]